MKYFIIAGEASGDLHASNLMRELRKADPETDFCFLGGDLMQAQGGKMIKHYRKMAFMGFWGVLKNARKVLDNINECKKAIIEFQPDVVILVDYPGFNLPMAKFTKVKLNIPVYYYISPKIWAWKEHRINDIKKYVDKVFTIFPFETTFYAGHDYPAEYIGNPSVDSVSMRPNQLQTFKEFCTINNLPNKPIIAILAGSRKQEISACIPRMINATLRFPEYQAVIAGAPGIDPKFYNSIIKDKSVQIVFDQTYELLQQAKAAIVNSGTATLETALIGTPEVVVYNVYFGRFMMVLKDLFVKVKYISLVNLVAEKEVVKELMAHYFTVETVSKELDNLLHNKSYRENMLNEYMIMKNSLGGPGAAGNAAKRMVELLSASRK